MFRFLYFADFKAVVMWTLFFSMIFRCHTLLHGQKFSHKRKYLLFLIILFSNDDKKVSCNLTSASFWKFEVTIMSEILQKIKKIHDTFNLRKKIIWRT